MTQIQYENLLKALDKENVKYIVVGGVAALLHGSARFTQDLDIVYERSKENIRNLVVAVKNLNVKLRTKEKELDLPFIFDETTIFNGLNFTLTTNLGDIDILGEITGGGKYENLIQHSVIYELFGIKCPCVDLITLISLKKAAGRPKDFEAIAELEILLEEKSKKKK